MQHHRTGLVSAVAIPARNEAQRIAACIEALDTQAGAQITHIVLLANNCTDHTAAIARAVPVQPGTTLHIVELDLPRRHANAGHARRLAMQRAAALAGPDGLLLTTDADGRVDPDWLAANIAAIANGADVVAGWVELDAIEWGQIPAILHEDDARECAYDQLCDTIHALLDPDPADPLPRHTQHSGASIALTAAAFARCGGVPDIPSGEDRALIEALRATGARIRHAPEVHVTVSGRLDGRAPGGMAETILRRMSGPDPYLDDRLEPALDCARRATSRRLLRELLQADEPLDGFAGALGLDPAWLRSLLGQPFGAVWQAVEAKSPTLRRRPVAVQDLPAEVQTAQALLAQHPLTRQHPADAGLAKTGL